MNIPTGRPAVLLVDDDPDILTALHDLLEHDGFFVTGVLTCRGALSQIKIAQFAAVLLDIGLPDGDGISALETIQNLAPSLPVIILTAFTSRTTGQNPCPEARSPTSPHPIIAMSYVQFYGSR